MPQHQLRIAGMLGPQLAQLGFDLADAALLDQLL
jgi:hypothetical protein